MTVRQVRKRRRIQRRPECNVFTSYRGDVQQVANVPPAWVASGTVVNVTTTAVNLVIPASIANGQVMVAILGNAASITYTLPSGWTSRSTSTGSWGIVQIATKTASGETPSGTYTFTASAGGTRTLGNITTLEGVKEIPHKTGTPATRAGVATQTYVTPSVTTTVSGCLILRHALMTATLSGGNPTNMTWPTSTERTDTNGTGGMRTTVATLVQAVAGATGTETVTVVGLAADHWGSSNTLAFEPL